MYDIFNAYNIEEFLEAFADAFGLMLFFSNGLSIILFILKGFGLYRMAKSLAINNPWLSFIPFADLYILGTIASKYIKKDGSKSARFGITLPILYAIEFIATIVFYVVFVVLCLNLIVDAESGMLNPDSFSIVFSDFIPFIISLIAVFVFAIVYKVIFLVALWRVYSIFDNANSTLFLVLSILFNFLAPIFIFIMSKNFPAFNLRERNDYFEVEKM